MDSVARRTHDSGQKNNDLVILSGEYLDSSEFLQAALTRIASEIGAGSACFLRAEKGVWRSQAAVGRAVSPPDTLLGDVLDQGGAATAGGWIAVPIAVTDGLAEVLAAESKAPVDQFESLASEFAAALSIVRQRENHVRRIRRLEAILEIAGQWNQQHEMEALLQQMAETSTRLLQAERASIFIWDKQNKTLVGRPALGVEGGELRIPDDRGIVGQVVQSGELRRVDQEIATEQSEIDRSVDKQLDFETRTLLCVPLRGRDGELFGAFEMINKIGGNFTAEDEDALTELAAHAAIALENTQEIEALVATRKKMADHAAEGVKLVGESSSIEALRSTVRKVADTELAVLILGENGTGKEVVAQLVHYWSGRRDQPFVAVNCAALTETLLESELFGHEKGAFTDAHESRAGKFELASGGTLFLDEIGDLSPSGQAKLLRVLEEKVVVRVGGSTPIHTDARVLAATNQDLAKMVREKTFREDLFFRLNVVTLELPPLRDRGDDVVLLAEHFLADFCAKARRKTPKFTAAAKKRLRAHTWPGNIRELRNLMERLAYLSQGEKVDADDFNFILTDGEEGPGVVPMNLPLAEATSRFQTFYIERHINSSGGNLSEAAKRIGVHRSNLYRKMKQLGMTTDSDSGETADDG